MAAKYTKKHTGKVLEKYKRILVEELKRQLRAKPAPTTVSDGSKLEESIKARKIKNLDGFEVSMNSYGLNVNQGRSSGTLPNPYRLEEWVNRNSNKLGIKDATPSKIKKVAFAIRSNIQKKGIKPYRFIDIVIDKFEPQLTKDIANSYLKDLREYFDKNIPNPNKG